MSTHTMPHLSEICEYARDLAYLVDAAGGLAAAAAVLDTDPQMVRGWLTGETPIPAVAAPILTRYLTSTGVQMPSADTNERDQQAADPYGELRWEIVHTCQALERLGRVVAESTDAELASIREVRKVMNDLSTVFEDLDFLGGLLDTVAGRSLRGVA